MIFSKIRLYKTFYNIIIHACHTNSSTDLCPQSLPWICSWCRAPRLPAWTAPAGRRTARGCRRTRWRACWRAARLILPAAGCTRGRTASSGQTRAGTCTCGRTLSSCQYPCCFLSYTVYNLFFYICVISFWKKKQ